MSISTQITIPGTARDVWVVLTDLPSYPAWNPFIRKVEGRLEEGARWKAELTLDGRLFFPVPTTITCWSPEKCLTWRGGIPAMMTGSHSFALFENEGSVAFEQSESFSGRLVPIVSPLLVGALSRRFVEMNEALKREVERRCRER